jgi:hypothetical protein
VRRSLLMLGVALAGLILAAPMSPASAGPDDPVPSVTCVWKNTDGSLTAVFGYTKKGPTKTLRVGPDNRVSPGAQDQGQPTTFVAGTVTNAFTVTWASGNLNWKLGPDTASASSTSTKCTAKPVPMLGSLRALGVGLLGLVVLGTLVLRRRPGVLRRTS